MTRLEFIAWIISRYHADHERMPTALRIHPVFYKRLAEESPHAAGWRGHRGIGRDQVMGLDVTQDEKVHSAECDRT